MALSRLSSRFDVPVNRVGTGSLKYDGRSSRFGSDEVTPLWLADMDFAVPEAVTAALVERAEHPIYGYSEYPESLYQSLQQWFERRHNWPIARDSIVICPGIMSSVYATITALTAPGDKIIIQPPVYLPFFSAIHDTGRTLVENPLLFEHNHYRMDLEHLERCAQDGASVLLLCSPHNPVSRVWQRTELEALLAIVKRYNMTIISDDIHADLVLEPYTALATLDNTNAVITALSPGKSFNMPGLSLTALVVDDPQQRQAITKVYQQWQSSNMNPFSICSFEAAYNGGEAWLDALLPYLQATQRAVGEYLLAHVPNIKLVRSEGAYLLWLDCRELAMSDTALQRFFIEQAQVAMSPGDQYGTGGSGFMRLNIGAPRAQILAAVASIGAAVAGL